MIERAAQRVDVAPGVDRVRVPGLLGRDVVERADRGPVAGDLVLLGQVDRQAQVGQLGGPVVGDQDVVGVDVAVDQPLLLGVLQPQRDLPGQPRRGGRRDRAVLGDQRADRLALDVLHHEVALAVGLALVVDPHEVLVLELGPDPRLALEPGDRPRVVHPLGREDLQRHPAVQPGVPGQVDPAHPPLADQVEQDVAVDLEARWTGPPGAAAPARA